MPLLETLRSGSGRTRLLLHTVCGTPTQGQVWGEALLRGSAVARTLQALRYQASHAWPLPITDIGCQSAGSYTCRLVALETSTCLIPLRPVCLHLCLKTLRLCPGLCAGVGGL